MYLTRALVFRTPLSRRSLTHSSRRSPEARVLGSQSVTTSLMPTGVQSAQRTTSRATEPRLWWSSLLQLEVWSWYRANQPAIEIVMTFLTLALLQPELDKRRIGPRRVCDTRSRRPLGNASQLEQLFLNLCLNALEAMDSDGELT